MTQSEDKVLTLGSLFDGIGGWQLAAIKAGVKPIWSSEIEPFPLAVTKLRYPETMQLGDITKIDGAKIPPVDIICMGSPCQDLSIAGKREGLQGERSGLFRVAVRLIRSMRVSTGGGTSTICCLGKRPRSVHKQRRNGLPCCSGGIYRVRNSNT